MKDKKRRQSDCISTNVTCVTWNLPAIPCLGIETGDTLDEVTFAIVEKICKLSTDDLSSIELQCLIDKLNITAPSEKTITTFLQLAFDNDCALFDLIQDVKDLVNKEDTPLTLDLKCLAQFDSFGNQLPYTQQSVLQSLITQGCSLVTQIGGLSGAITNVNNRIDGIIFYTEPKITSCLYSGTKSLSQATSLLASDYCSFRTKIGSISQIEQSIGKQTPILGDSLFPVSDLLLQPSSLSESDFNQWVFIANNYKRLLDLEACACRAKCSDIKIGFNAADQEDGQSIVIEFSGDYGNYIPPDYSLQTDSTITFIDKNTRKKSFQLPTTPGIFATEYNSPIYDISMLDLTGMLTIKVCVKLKNTKTGEICCKCEESQHLFIGGCAFCEIIPIEDVTIVYINSVGNTQSTDIRAGNSYVLPSRAKIISVSDINALGDIPGCFDLTTLEDLGCYVAMIGSWAENVPGITDTGFWEGSGGGHQIIGLEIEGNNYLLPTPIEAYLNNNQGNFNMEYAASEIKDLHGLILDANGTSNIEGNPRSLGVSINYLQIKTVASFANKIKLITRSTTSSSLTGNKTVMAYLKFIPVQQAVSEGYSNVPLSLCTKGGN